MLARHDALFELGFAEEVLPLLDRVGHMPLPPYIDRPDEGSDRERYQTVYAERLGAVAAPTAGLHFRSAAAGGHCRQGCRDGICDPACRRRYVPAGAGGAS